MYPYYENEWGILPIEHNRRYVGIFQERVTSSCETVVLGKVGICSVANRSDAIKFKIKSFRVLCKLAEIACVVNKF